MKTKRHFKWFRTALPPTIRFKNTPLGLSGEVKFSSSCRYNHKDQDQADWNKLTGISFALSAQVYSVMVGWRYSIEKDKIELCAYYHEKGDTFFTEPLAEIEINEVCSFAILVSYSTKKYTVAIDTKKETFKHVQSFTHSRKWSRVINSWFGGNKKPPHKMKFKLKIILL